MKKLVLKRLLNAIPLLFAVTIVAFLLIKLSPGDPVLNYVTPDMSEEDIERIRTNMGLNEPIYIQYFSWLKQTLTGNFGYSLISHRPVIDLIIERLPATVGLMGASITISIIIAIPLGLLAGLKKDSVSDKIINFFSYIGISIPVFWLGLLLIYLFSLKLNLLPSMGMRTIGEDSFLDIAKHAILPCTVLAFHNISIYFRYIRASTLAQLEEEYVQVQYSFGASKLHVLFHHVLKNIMLPIVTIIGLSIPSLVSGAFITESVFSWPGLGLLGVSSIFSFDYPVIMTITLLSSVMLILGNLIADILYGVVDPRIRG